MSDPALTAGLEAGSQKKKPRGLAKLGHDLLHRRRRFRQFGGAVFVFLVTLAGSPTPALFWTGVVLSTLGMAVRSWASGYVMKNEVLATVGPYARVRHPLYVGNLLICAGFCAASGLWWSVPLALGFLWLFYPETIRYEDQKLRRLFPEQWDAWAARTKALIPSLTPYPASGEVSWSLSRSLLRNGEPIHILILVGCLIWLWTLLPVV